MSDPAIIFLRSTGRSGSKQLAAWLGTHPEIARVPVNECLPEELFDHCVQRLRARLPRAPHSAFEHGVRAFFDAYCASQVEPARWTLQKSTGHVHHLDTLLTHWPEARLLFLVRHPIDVIRSLVSTDIARYHGQYGYRATVLNAALRWANDTYAFLRSHAAQDPRLHLVRFEDLLRPEATGWSDLWRHLDLEDPGPPPVGKPSGYGHTFEFTPEEHAWLLDAVSELARALGYRDDDAPPPASNVDPATHRDRRLTGPLPPLDAHSLLADAIRSAHAAGRSRIGLYGAGTAARLLAATWPADLERPVVIIDDDRTLAGSALAGIPVAAPDEARALELETVIPMTFVHEAAMTARWIERFGASIPVTPFVPAASFAAPTT